MRPVSSLPSLQYVETSGLCVAVGLVRVMQAPCACARDNGSYGKCVGPKQRGVRPNTRSRSALRSFAVTESLFGAGSRANETRDHHEQHRTSVASESSWTRAAGRWPPCRLWGGNVRGCFRLECGGSGYRRFVRSDSEGQPARSRSAASQGIDATQHRPRRFSGGSGNGTVGLAAGAAPASRAAAEFRGVAYDGISCPDHAALDSAWNAAPASMHRGWPGRAASRGEIAVSGG